MGAEAVLRQSSGYCLGEIELDLDVLGLFVELARRCVSEDRLDDAVNAYRSARGLFRGRPLPELTVE